MESKMKMVILILVIFVVFDSCWAMEKEKGAAAHLLDHNDAKHFLLHKRQNICFEYQEHVNEEFIFHQSVYEECCNEGCDTEELRENAELSTGAAAEDARENYMNKCCSMFG